MPSAVFIGAADVLSTLRGRVGAADDALAFSDSEPLEALKAITTHRPALIVLERLFAATPRGAALINRIKSDPSLTHVEVRVVSQAGDYVRIVARPTSGTVAASASANPSPETAGGAAVRPLDWHGTRRAPRVRFRDGVEIQLDGNVARIVDMSIIGAQAICPRSLRPDQRIRVAIQNERETVRFRAAVVWARFELAHAPTLPHYRVGMEFIDADPDWLASYCHKNRLAI